MFYKTHKISRVDFLSKLQRAKDPQEREAIIMELYEDPAQQGRKGILSLSKSVKIIRKKIEER